MIIDLRYKAYRRTIMFHHLLILVALAVGGAALVPPDAAPAAVPSFILA